MIKEIEKCDNEGMKKIQLFCIPFAGGSSYSFKDLTEYISDEIEVIPIEYPGRGKRLKTPYFETFPELLLDVKKQIEEKRDRSIPFCLLGYSMGTAVAYDLIQYALEERSVYAFMCARESLELYAETKEYVLLDSEDFISAIVKMGGVDKRILDNKRFLDIYIRPVYADYKLWSQYNYDSNRGKPEVDFSIFYSEKDTPRESVEGWRGLTSGAVDFFEFGENHFFLFDYPEEIAEVINEKLAGLIL